MEKREKFSCSKCGKDVSFTEGTHFEDKKCPYCGLIKLKSWGSVPTKGEIKAFLLFKTVKCRNCGRTLTNEKSIADGFGPSCGAYFGRKYLKQNPDELGEKARRKWTPDEIKALMNFARGRT